METKISTFQDIIAWQKAHELALFVYKITDNFPRNEEFGLKSQIRRAAVSVPSNIAEGFKRKSKADSVHFYNISEASLEEMKYQLILSRDLKYISTGEYEAGIALAEEVGRTLSGWLKSQRIYI
jgi:four helix bundle protein